MLRQNYFDVTPNYRLQLIHLFLKLYKFDYLAIFLSCTSTILAAFNK